MTDITSIQSLSAARLQDILQSMGYRVTRTEQNGMVQLLSATQGIGFAVRFGNPSATEGEFVDYTLSCALRVQGDLPQGLVQAWNVGKRFARLAQQGIFLVLEMDVIAAGGVSENHLRATTELWDRLLQDFLLFLRQYATQAAQGEPAAEQAPAEPATADADTAGGKD
ncbi:YbjN domain-containing protein [Bordetella genomosp. 13]|uniref:YbjN domain-containing protein n=1 Tax=Bordetella genomosp. 13 TaxID=463040 RepID=UPI00119D5890|nr:YbjN domain-containing protein [Bordetella genomosp. 13]